MLAISLHSSSRLHRPVLYAEVREPQGLLHNSEDYTLEIRSDSCKDRASVRHRPYSRKKKMRYVAIVTGKAYNYKFSECRIPFYVWNSPKYPRSCIPVMGRKSSSTCEKRSIECPYAFEPFLSTSPCHFFPSNARIFFPPLTLMPCDSGRDNQLRVKSPTNDCDH